MCSKWCMHQTIFSTNGACTYRFYKFLEKIDTGPIEDELLQNIFFIYIFITIFLTDLKLIQIFLNSNIKFEVQAVFFALCCVGTPRNKLISYYENNR